MIRPRSRIVRILCVNVPADVFVCMYVLLSLQLLFNNASIQRSGEQTDLWLVIVQCLDLSGPRRENWPELQKAVSASIWSAWKLIRTGRMEGKRVRREVFIKGSQQPPGVSHIHLTDPELAGPPPCSRLIWNCYKKMRVYWFAPMFRALFRCTERWRISDSDKWRESWTIG